MKLVHNNYGEGALLINIPFFIFFQVTVDLSHFPEFQDDAAFASGMLIEQSVFTLPGMVREQDLLIFPGAHYIPSSNLLF